MLNRLATALFALLTLSLAQSVHARWDLLAAFDAPIQSMFFFNERVGFIGFDDNATRGIHRTTDAGKTWTPCTTVYPPGEMPRGGRIQSIYMRDKFNGWAVVEGYNDRLGMLRTTDGGVNWHLQTSYVGGPSCVIETPTAVIVTERTRTSPGGGVSLDGGVTFQRNVLLRTNGVAKVDDLHLVATCIDSQVWQRSTDGGRVWTAIGIPDDEAWSVYGDSLTKTFYTAGEGMAAYRAGGTWILKSVDFGRTWSAAGRLPFRSTGHIAGMANAMYIQYDYEDPGFNPPPLQRGIYRSTNGGAAWLAVGGPAWERDTRFFVTGCKGGIVYAASNANTAGKYELYKTRDGGDGAIVEPPLEPTFESKSITITSRICSAIQRALPFQNKYCVEDSIVSITFLDQALAAAGALTIVQSPVLPKLFLPNQSDSIVLRWDPSLITHRDTTFRTRMVIRYHSFALGVDAYDTIILDTRATGDAPDLTFAPQTLLLDSINACTSGDTLIAMRNNGCDTLLVTSLLAQPDYALLDVNGAPLSLPIRIPPDSMGRFVLRVSRKQVGPYASSFDVGLEHQGIKGTRSVAFSGAIRSATEFAFAAAVDFDSISICEIGDTVISLHNTSCDSLRIVGAALKAASDFGLAPTGSLPIALAPDSVQRFRIGFVPSAPGIHLDSLILDIVVNGEVRRLAIAVEGAASSDSSTLIASQVPQFPDRTRCDPPDTLIFTIANPGCTGLALRTLALRQGMSNIFTLRTSPSFPDTLKNNDSVRIWVVVSHNVVGTFDDTLTLSYRFLDKPNVDTSFALHAKVDYGTRLLSLATDERDLGRIPFCETAIVPIVYQNTGCDTMTVTDESLAGKDFTVMTPGALPRKIRPGAQDTIWVEYRPSTTDQRSAQLSVVTDADSANARLLTILGAAIPTDTVSFTAREITSGVIAGGVAVIGIYPNVTRPSPSLRSVSGTLTYNSDVMKFAGGEANDIAHTFTPGVELQTFGRHVLLPFTLTKNSGILLDSTQPIARLSFRTTLSDSSFSTVALSDVRLNGGDQVFQKCVLGGRGESSTLDLMLMCGDSVIKQFMMKGVAITLRAHPIYPNPADGTLDAALLPFEISEQTAGVTLRLFDSFGRLALQQSLTAQKGTNTVSIPLHALSSGQYRYLLSIVGAEGGVTGGFVVRK